MRPVGANPVMHLTQFADHSLRTLVYLACVPEGASVGKIALAYGISRNHLVKVAHQLVQLGYVKSKRGKSGGLRLNMVPEEISLLRVVRQVEPDFELVECFNSKTDTCPITSICGLRTVLGEANAAFLKVLSQYTIADLLPERDVLLEHLYPHGTSS